MKIFNSSSKSNVQINGVSYSGNSININGDNVFIDGVQQKVNLTGPISVCVEGNIEHLEMGSGKVKADDVGNITTGSGDVSCHNVHGNIRTGSGDVTCLIVNGSVKTGSGDIIHRGK